MIVSTLLTLITGSEVHLFPFSYGRKWKLAPAYDLTFSSGPNGEQSTMVMGAGKNPGNSHLLELGKEAKFSKKLINEIIDQTKSALGRWQCLSENYNVSEVNIRLVLNSMNGHTG